MNEKQNRLMNHSDGYLPFSSEDTHKGKSSNPLALQTQEGNDVGNTHELEGCSVEDGLSKYTKTVIRASLTDDDHSAASNHLIGDKDTDMRNYDEHDQDLLNTPELECAMINDDNHNKHEPGYLVPPVVTSSEIFQEHKNIYMDDDVLDYKPELIVCYKEINYDVVKDTGVDEGTLLEDKGLVNLHFDNSVAPCPSENASDEQPGDLDFELLVHDALEVSSEPDDDVLDKEEGNVVSPFARKSKSLADLMNLDYQNPDVLSQASEKDAGNKIENAVMNEESIVTRLVPIEKLGIKSFIRSVIRSLKDQEDEAQPKQACEHANMDKSHPESVLENDNRDYSKNRTFISAVLSSSLNGGSMKIHQDAEPNYKDGMNKDTVCETQNADMKDNSRNIHQPIAANNIVDSENPTLDECKDIIESRSIQKSHQQLQNESLSSNCPANSEVPSAEVNEICSNASSTIPGEACNGEEICVVSGRVGSTSMRSESSTTSSKSFAFPVLQAEWNSSPVMMGNAKRGPLRKKRRSWRRDILCCRC